MKDRARRSKRVWKIAALLLPFGLGAALWRVKAAADRAHKPLYSILIPKGGRNANSVQMLTFSADGQRLAVSDTYSRVWAWNVETRTLTPLLRARVSSEVESLGWKRDRLVIGDPHSVMVFQPTTGVLLRQRPLPPKPYDSRYEFDHYAQCVISDKATLAALGQLHGAVAVWDVQSGRRRFGIKALDRETCGLAIAPDDQTVAVASLVLQPDAKEHYWPNKLPTGLEIALRDARTGKLKRIIRWDAGVFERTISFDGSLGNTGLAFSPDGKLLAASGVDGFALWDVRSGELLRAVQRSSAQRWGGHRWIAFSPNGAQVAEINGGSQISVWSTGSGELLQTFYGVDNHRAMAYSPDSRLLAAGGQDAAGRAVVKVWDVENLR